MSEETQIPVKKIYYDPISVAKRTKQIAYFVGEHDKPALLEQIIKNIGIKQTIIVVKSKRSADELSEYLKSKDFKATAIHGNHRAEKLEDTAKAFNAGELNILVTTDMILQSLDLTNIQLMLSYDLPSEAHHYLTRVGYLKEVGESIAFVSPEDDKSLVAIEFAMKADIEEGEVEGFTPTPHSHTSKVKDKKKKPRHRKKKAKKPTKEE